ncbi:MAG: phage tail sheath C-terminal domain-containing protein [Granulosicoccus sp.]
MPPTLSFPGVNVIEQPSRVHAIKGVKTATTLFIGMAQKGPLGRPTPIRSTSQYAQIFGNSHRFGEMAIQVHQFFINGGSEAIVVRAANMNTVGTLAVQAAITLTCEAGDDSGGAQKVLAMTARDADLSSNDLRSIVDYNTPTPELTFNIEIFRKSVDANGAISISENERFNDLSMDPEHPRYVRNILDTQSALVSATTFGAPSRTDIAFSLSGLVLHNAEASAAKTLNEVVGCGGNICVTLGNTTTVTIGVPPVTSSTTAWVREVQDAINIALETISPPTTVDVSLVKFATGQCIRISPTAGTANSQSVTVTPAAVNDVAVALQLGSVSGGIEIGLYSRFRPAPSGYVTRINEAISNTFDQNSSLQRLESFVQIVPESLTHWVFDEGLGAMELRPSVRLSFRGAKKDLLEGNANNDGVGSLRNTLRHFDELVASLRRELGTTWSVSRCGFRIAITPTSGTSNAGVDAVLTSPGLAILSDTSKGVFTAAQAANTAHYSFGTSGTTRRQTDGVAGGNGDDADPPQLGEYQEIFNTIEQNFKFNLMILPRCPGQTDAERARFWGPASQCCQKMRALLIVDPPSDTNTGWTNATDVLQGISALRAGAVTDHAALYWPRIKVTEQTSAIDPSGTVAGIMARTDGLRGVWKAPAGVEAKTLGSRGFEHMLSDTENTAINREAINTLRQFPHGDVIWAARTMAGFSNSGKINYRYVPVRRTAMYIEESLLGGLRFAVFEPNDEPLWSQIRLATNTFMQGLFRQGAFQGRTPSEAYTVRCDSTTTTQSDVSMGRVNVLVGFAPLRPAEFIVLTVQHKAGQIEP